MSTGIDNSRRRARPGISQGWTPMASSSKIRTILIGTPVQKAGHATARPNFTDDMEEA